MIDRPITLKANAFKTGLTTSATVSAAFTISGKLAGGTSHSVALESDGTVWSFGANASAQLGIGSADANTHAVPLQVKTNATTFLTGMSVVGAGASHSMAIRKSDGSVFGWGNDSAGQLGDNSTATQQPYPVQAKTTATGNPLLLGMVDVAGGASHSVALKSDGTVWTWGSNTLNQLGDGGTTSRKLAAQVKTANNTFLTGIVAIASGDNFCVAVKSDGTVWAWGSNASGQIGIGSTTNQKFAVQVKLTGGAALTGVIDIACGSNHAIALKSDGTVWTWGSNTNGQLGNGTTAQATNPVQTKTASATFISGVSAVAGGANHSAFLKSDGSVYSVGLNSSGQLSINSTAQQLYATQASSSAGVSLSGVVDLACGASHTVVTKNDGTVLGGGLNSSGQAGYPTTTINPLRVTPIGNFFVITAFADPDSDGLPTWQERELGTNPTLADTDADGIPDGWEVNHNLNPLVNDSSANPDGDSFTNLQEYQNNTDPFDYYNAAPFTLTITGGNNQTSPSSAWLTQPLAVETKNGSGLSLSNAPVSFSLGQVGGGLSLTNGGVTTSSLSLRTDATGKAAVYYQQPATGTASTVTAQAGTGNIQQVIFNATIQDIPASGLQLWLRADTGVSLNGPTSVSQWLDQSANLFALQGSGSQQPQLIANAVNGKPVLRFDGGANILQTAGAADIFKSSASWTVILVTQPGATQQTYANILDHQHDSLSFVMEQNGGNANQYWIGDDLVALDSTRTQMLASVRTASTQRDYMNGMKFADLSVNPFSPQVRRFGVGGWLNGGRFYNGDIAEVIIYNRALTDSERAGIENLLNSRYALVSTPPSAPSNLIGSVVSPTQVTLNWATQGAVLSKIERKLGVNGAYAQIATTTNASVTVYNDSALSTGATYYYRVRAFNLAGDSSYGNEVSVTTSSAGATLPMTGMKLWLRADFGVTKDGNNLVSRWADQSATGNDATQTVSGNSPSFVPSGLVGKPVVRFNGSSGFMSGRLGLGTQMSMFAVAKSGAGSGYKRVITNEGHFYLGTGVEGNFASFYGNGTWGLTQSHPAAFPANQFKILESINNGTDSAYLDGQLVEARANAMGAFVNGFELGRYPAGSQYWDGDIVEVLIYDGALSSTDRQSVEAYLNGKYNGDSDGDGIPDLWEVNHGLNPLVNDASLDPDGDGFTNLHEYQNGTDPADYYNGGTFNLNISSGNEQVSAPDTWLAQPLVVRVTNGSGSGLSNAPVTFSANQSGISATNGGTLTPTLATRTDPNGNATVYFRQPSAVDTTTAITVQTGTVPVKSVVFTASNSNLPLPGLRLWLRADAGVTLNGNSAVAQWSDQSPSHMNLTAGAGQQPQLMPGVLNGKAVLHFDGGSSILQTASTVDLFQASPAWTVFLLTRPGATQQSYANILDQQHDSVSFVTEQDGGNTNRFRLGDDIISLDPNRAQMVTSVRTATTQQDYMDGVRIAALSVSPFSPQIRRFGVGGWLNGGRFYNGDIAEVLIYNRALSSSERTVVESYLNQRYSVVSTIPASPSSLAGSAYGASQVNLSWAPLGTVLFKIERKVGATGTYAQIGATTTSGVTIYHDNSVLAGTEYFYRIRAFNAFGDSGYSNEISVTTSLTAPVVPTSGLQLWLRADSEVTVDGGGKVSVWADQSSIGNTATQGNGSLQPQLISTGMNGHPTLRFNNNLLTIPNLVVTGTSQFTWVYVAKWNSTALPQGYQFLMSQGVDTPTTGYFAGLFGGSFAGMQLSSCWGSYYGGIKGRPVVADQPTVGIATYDGAKHTVTINGISQGSVPKTDSNFNQGGVTNIGAYLTNTYFAQADLSEVMVFNRALAPSEMNQLGTYFNQKYGFIAAPSAPSNLQAQAISPTQVSLLWSHPLGDWSTQFIVERAPVGGAFSVIATVDQTTSYVDATASAGVSYSYRVLATNYAGSSGYSNVATANAAPGGDPIPFDRLQLWLRADAGVAADGGGKVYGWRDQSSAGNWAAQSTVALQPQVIETGINGRPTVRFNNNLLTIPNLVVTGTSQFTWVYVAKWNSTALPQVYQFLMSQGVDTPTTGYFAGLFGGSFAGMQLSSCWGSYYGGIKGRTVVANQPTMGIATYDGAKHTLTINGISQGSVPKTDSNFNQGGVTNIGAYLTNTYFAQADLSEVMVFDRALSSSEVDQLGYYLNQKYLFPEMDADADGLSNAEEQALGTDPLNWDSNGDGISDGVSVTIGVDPLSQDDDNDGLSNAAEFALGTNFLKADTDGDGVADGVDAFPLDPSRSQLPSTPGDTTPPGITLFEPVGATPIP
ncbi:MAG: large repetitive protein [Verrucomicrobiota bacterium]